MNVVVTTDVHMPVGTYAGEIVFTGPEINGATSMTVPVTLTVEPAGSAFLNNLPGQLAFSLKTGRTTLTSQAIQVLNGGQGNLNWTLAKTTADGGDWLTVSAMSGTAPSLVNVGYLCRTCPEAAWLPGRFIGELVFFNSGGGISHGPSECRGRHRYLSTGQWHQLRKGIRRERSPAAGTDRAQHREQLRLRYELVYVLGRQLVEGRSRGFNCCTTPRAVNVVVTTDLAMPVGTYTGEIVFTGPEINGGSAITVPVTLTVKPVGAPLFNNVPGHLAFSLKTANTNLTNQTFQIVNGGAGSLDWSVRQARRTAETG